MNKALTVLAECVDSRSGKRFVEGDEFSPAPTPAQAKRLVAAGCLPEEAVEAAAAAMVDPVAVVVDQINNDGLFDLTDDQLAEVAEKQGVQVEDRADRATVIAAIREHRTANPPAPDPENVVMRTEEGERAARDADKAATDRYASRSKARAAK